MGRRVPELDGVRGIAILLVVAGHLLWGIGPVPRPLIDDRFARAWTETVGVQVFLALSGYLITRLLVAEFDRSDGIALRSFWWRRLRRLYPPLIAMCAAYLVIMALWPWTRGENWNGLGDIAMALTYTANVAWLVVPRSGWLGHTWSLAVEEQFYLVWPLVVLAVLGRRSRSTLAALCVAGVVVTVAARWVLPDSLHARGLRWDALLLGALVALTGWRARASAAWAAVAVLVVLSAVPLERDNLLYTVSAAAAAVLVAGAAELGWLRNRVLVHFGYISYSLYLWHVLVMRFAPHPVVSLAVSLVAAEISYRLIERRFMANPPPARPWPWRRDTVDLRRDGPPPAPPEPDRQDDHGRPVAPGEAH